VCPRRDFQEECNETRETAFQALGNQATGQEDRRPYPAKGPEQAGQGRAVGNPRRAGEAKLAWLKGLTAYGDDGASKASWQPRQSERASERRALRSAVERALQLVELSVSYLPK
jgi:hypothetical protein